MKRTYRDNVYAIIYSLLPVIRKHFTKQILNKRTRYYIHNNVSTTHDRLTRYERFKIKIWYGYNEISNTDEIFLLDFIENLLRIF